MFSYHIYGHWHTVHIWWAWVWSPSLCKDISQDINLSRHRARHRVRGWPPPSSGLSPAFDCRPQLALGPKGSNVRSTLLCTSLYLPFNGNQTSNWYCMVLQGIEWYCKLHWYYSSDPEWLAYLPSKKNVCFVKSMYAPSLYSGTGLSENIFDSIHCEEGCRLQLAVEDVVLNEE